MVTIFHFLSEKKSDFNPPETIPRRIKPIKGTQRKYILCHLNKHKMSIFPTSIKKQEFPVPSHAQAL